MKMKRLTALIIAIAMIAVLASCDTKSCKCYIYDGNNPAQRVTEYIDDGTPCGTLDYTRGKRYRICTEYNEQDIDPSQIGQEYKK
jgi:hypothetical protein